MKPNPHDMLIFLAVVEARSFTGASLPLGITKSAISQAVSRLEYDLGVQLLFRSTRSLSLTEAGAHLVPHCKALRELHNDTLAQFHPQSRALRDTLTVTAPHALCQSLIVPVLSLYRQKFPQSSVRLVATDATVNLVEHTIDVAIRVGSTAPQTAKISKIGVVQESLYATPDYIRAKGGRPDTYETLSEWIHIANAWQGSPVTYQFSGKSMLKVTPHIRCDNVINVVNFILEHQGVACLPDVLMQEYLNTKAVEKLFTVSQTNIFILHKYGVKLPPKVKHFTRLLKKQMSISDL